MKQMQEPVMLLALPAEHRVCPPSQLNLGNCVVSAQQNSSATQTGRALSSRHCLIRAVPYTALLHTGAALPFNLPLVKSFLTAVGAQSTTENSYSEFSYHNSGTNEV